ELHLPQAVRDLAKLPHGLILVTGLTGCGKSTTQASLLDSINRERPVHIITIEDPIEYTHDNHSAVVDQREIGHDAPSFADALRSTLREDPDVVQVGEMRDLESIAIALTIAETGHLVLGTLHSNDAAQAIHRMVDYEDAVSRSLFPNEIRRQPMTLSGTVQEPTFQPMAGSSLKHAG